VAQYDTTSEATIDPDDDMASVAGAPAGGSSSVSSGFAWRTAPRAVDDCQEDNRWYLDWAVGRSRPNANCAGPPIDGGGWWPAAKGAAPTPGTPADGAEATPANLGPWA